MNLTIKDIVYIGVMSAICGIATTILVPLPTGGMVHLGSAALFTLSILFGGLYGGLGGAIGSGLFDILMGHTQYTLFSIVIKGGAGFIIGYLASSIKPPLNIKCPNFLRMVLALLIGAIWTAFGYFIAWWYVLGSITVATTRLPASFITSGVGAIITLLIVPRLYNLAQKVLKASK